MTGRTPRLLALQLSEWWCIHWDGEHWGRTRSREDDLEFSFEDVEYDVSLRHPLGIVKYTYSLEPRGQVWARNTN